MRWNLPCFAALQRQRIPGRRSPGGTVSGPWVTGPRFIHPSQAWGRHSDRGATVGKGEAGLSPFPPRDQRANGPGAPPEHPRFAPSYQILIGAPRWEPRISTRGYSVSSSVLAVEVGTEQINTNTALFGPPAGGQSPPPFGAGTGISAPPHSRPAADLRRLRLFSWPRSSPASRTPVLSSHCRARG